MGWEEVASAGIGFLGQQETNQANASNMGIANIQNRQNMKSQMIYNARMAREERAHQIKMSNTAMQRGVKDMERAGINPLLGIAKGGASTPGNSSPTATAASAGAANVENAYSSAFTSAMETKRLLADIKKQNSEIDLLNANTKKASTEERVMRKGLPEAEIYNKVWNAIKTEAKTTKDWANKGYKIEGKDIEKHSPKKQEWTNGSPIYFGKP